MFDWSGKIEISQWKKTGKSQGILISCVSGSLDYWFLGCDGASQWQEVAQDEPEGAAGSGGGVT